MNINKRDTHYRDTNMLINMDSAFYNIDTLKKINNNKKIKAVVKANAYGHGLVSFASILEEYGKVDSFCVSNLDEALTLRKNGVTLPILVMGAVDQRHFNIALNNDITITVYSKEIADYIIDFDKPIKIQFKIDTGMNRIGFKDFEEFLTVYNIIKKTDIIVEGIYSHLSSADEEESFSILQINEFRKYADIMPKDIEIHIQNTAGSINYPNIDYVNTIRPGIGIYGINPIINKSSSYVDINLKELITIETRIVMIKELDKNETVGYNRTYKNPKKTRIATIPIGYADGFKLIYGKSFAYIEDDFNLRKFPICGKICMDQTMIIVDDFAKIGDYVTIIGDRCTVRELSNYFYVSPYEIMTSFSERLFKEYIINGKVIKADNQIFKN